MTILNRPDSRAIAAACLLSAAGALVFKVLQDNLEHRGIDVWLNTPAHRLVTDSNGRVTGVSVERHGAEVAIEARRGVVLACGGFEASAEMQAQYWQGKPVFSCAFLGNTGDGIRMAQAVGADTTGLRRAVSPNSPRKPSGSPRSPERPGLV